MRPTGRSCSRLTPITWKPVSTPQPARRTRSPVRTNPTPDRRRPSARRLSHANAGSIRKLPATPIKTRASGIGHVDPGSSRAAASANSSATAPRPPVRQAGCRKSRHVRACRRTSHDRMNSFCIVTEARVPQMPNSPTARLRCQAQGLQRQRRRAACARRARSGSSARDVRPYWLPESSASSWGYAGPATAP